MTSISTTHKTVLPDVPPFFRMFRRASGSRNKTPSLTAFKRAEAEAYPLVLVCKEYASARRLQRQ